MRYIILPPFHKNIIVKYQLQETKYSKHFESNANWPRIKFVVQVNVRCSHRSRSEPREYCSKASKMTKRPYKIQTLIKVASTLVFCCECIFDEDGFEHCCFVFCLRSLPSQCGPVSQKHIPGFKAQPKYNENKGSITDCKTMIPKYEQLDLYIFHCACRDHVVFLPLQAMRTPVLFPHLSHHPFLWLNQIINTQLIVNTGIS